MPQSDSSSTNCMSSGYTFKRAASPSEIEQVHRLNYETFVREIPQHPDPGQTRLVDKFHDKNVYFVALLDEKVVGMVAVHGEPPYSAAQSLPEPDVLTSAGRHVLEVRLLAVEPSQRHKFVFAGLLWSVHEFAVLNGHSHLVISGLRERQRLYRRLGFEPIGPPSLRGEAYFVPMLLTVGALPPRIERDVRCLAERMNLAL